MQPLKTIALVLSATCAGCVHRAPASVPDSASTFAVEVENATGVAIALGYCGPRLCGELGRLAAGETGRFSIAASEAPAVTLLGKDGDRWVARQRLDLRQGNPAHISLAPFTP